MSESILLEAKAEAVSKSGEGILIDGSWYNVPDKAAMTPEGGIKKGDTIKFKWSQGKDDKGRDGKQIRSKIIITEAAPKWDGNKGGFKGGNKGGFGGGFKKDPETQASIERQACLKAACELVAATLTGKSNPEDAAKMVVKITAETLLPFVQAASKKTAGEAPKPDDKPVAKASPVVEELEEIAPASAESGLEGFDDATPF